MVCNNVTNQFYNNISQNFSKYMRINEKDPPRRRSVSEKCRNAEKEIEEKRDGQNAVRPGERGDGRAL